jgi:DNA-directed RNA polymerase specialized sigma24 family protein
VKEDIIIQLYTDARFKRITRNACSECGYHFTEDMHSEVVLTIIENGDDLNEINNLFYYFHAFAIRVIKYNYATSKKYGYNKNRLDGISLEAQNESYDIETDSIVYDVMEEVDEKTTTDKFIERKEELLSDSANDNWRDKYERELFKLYIEHGSYREVQKAVGIPFRSVADALKSFKEKIKKKL